ncbi:MAG TPA: hypothetical protein VGB98_10835 [Pyrinomonadaceae bacterium]|jgi:hypothetical protein
MKTNACQMSEYRAGDEVLFKFEGLLVGTVQSVQFNGRRVRYQVTLDLECEVPEASVVSGGAQQICGGVPQSGGAQQTNGGAADI